MSHSLAALVNLNSSSAGVVGVGGVLKIGVGGIIKVEVYGLYSSISFSFNIAR